MPSGKPVSQELKAEILSKIRDEGMSVAIASAKYELNAQTIYLWLREGVIDGNRNPILENNRLRKENEQLYRLLGRLSCSAQKASHPGRNRTRVAKALPGSAWPLAQQLL